MPDYGTPENPYIVTIPGWDDIIKIHPRLKYWRSVEIANSDWAEFYRLRAQGRLNEFEDRIVLGEIQRRWDRIAAMKASPTPEIVQSVGKIMTMIDNTEDLLSTGLVVGRALAKKLPWLAARLANRTTAGALGVTLTARDVLEIIPYLWKFLPFGRRGKKKGWDVISPLNWGKRARLKRVNRFMRGKFGVPAAIEAAQATDTLFGTGLQLGGLVGLVQDSVFGAIQYAGGATVRISRDPEVTQLPDWDRVGFGWAAIFEFVIGFQWPFQNTHMIAIAGANLGVQIAHEIINDDEMVERSEIAAGFMMPHIMPWEPMTRLILEDHDIDPDRDEPHLYPGSPDEVSFQQMAQRGIDSAGDIMQNFLNMYPGQDENIFIASHISELAEWPYNADLPESEWEENRPTRENSIAESLLSETLEKGIRPPLEEDYIPTEDRTIQCSNIELFANLPTESISPGGLNYIDEIEALANDYRTIQESTGQTLIGYEPLYDLIKCHFGDTRLRSEIPTESEF